MRAVILLLLACAVAAPTAGAHLLEATATDLAGTAGEDQTITLRLLVHANGTFGIIGSLRDAREGGINYTGAEADFAVTAGPADELGLNGTRMAANGDLFLEFQDRNDDEEELTVEVRVTGVDASSAWINGTVAHAFAMFAHPSFDDHGNATAPFHVEGDPARNPTPENGAPGPGVALAFLASGAAVLARRRTQRD